MKKTLYILILLLGSISAWGGITTYTFTNANWKTAENAFTCDKAAYGYDQQQPYASPYGVKVTASYSGAGATSKQTFNQVRRITFHYGTTTKGKGSLHVAVGNWSIDTTVHTANPHNEDLVIILPQSETGTVSFQVNCTTNSLFINTLTIHSSDGASPVFTEDRYQLVTSADQLRDSDQIIIGVPTAGKLMGYFDETVSQNNIHAIPGRFSEYGSIVAANDDAIYTLRAADLNGTPCWIIQDEIRYEEAYLVASGGQTKNRLALWDNPSSPNYGNYGYWDIQIAPDGGATIMSLGTSAGKYLQYNASNSPTLFGCYATMSQTSVSLYRCVQAIGNQPAIVAPLVQFGEQIMSGTSMSGSETITVNANLLTADISARLTDGSIFALSRSTLDRDGEELTISYTVTEAGRYLDTLVLTSGAMETRVTVMLTVVDLLTVAEAVHMPDYSTIYLNDVVVTRKYDQYVFVRDDTGSMLLYDNGNGTGGRYASGVKQGDVLHGVRGKEWNYYGVPELNLNAAFRVQGSTSVEPEEVTSIDSSDVCRYVRIQSSAYPVVDAFRTGLTVDYTRPFDAIVMISHDELQLWLVGQPTTTGIVDVDADVVADVVVDVLGRPVGNSTPGVHIQRGKKSVFL